MILIHIVTSEEKQAWEMVDFLEGEKLIIDSLVINTMSRIRKNLDTSTQGQYLILGKTKALLFDLIDKPLREKYKNNLPSIFSTPIVNMDWDQRIELKEKTAKV